MHKITRRTAHKLIAAAGVGLAAGISAARAQQQAGGSAAPWETRRGLLNTDYNNQLLFIRAPIDGVASALADLTERWEKDVLGREIIINPQCAFVFRLQGHSWTIIAPLLAPVPFGWELATELHERAPALASQMRTGVIEYGVSDTTLAIGYSLYENGELLEQLNATEGSSGRPDDSSAFSSRLRSLKLEDIGNVWDFTHRFLVMQDVLEPGIDFGYFLSPFPPWPPHGGETVRVANPGFSTIMPDGTRSPADVPPMERVDYWVPRLGGR